MEEVFFFTVFGAAIASALLFAAAYLRARQRIARLEDRLMGAGTLDAELESRVNELTHRVAQLARVRSFCSSSSPATAGCRKAGNPTRRHRPDIPISAGPLSTAPAAR